MATYQFTSWSGNYTYITNSTSSTYTSFKSRPITREGKNIDYKFLLRKERDNW